MLTSSLDVTLLLITSLYSEKNEYRNVFLLFASKANQGTRGLVVICPPPVAATLGDLLVKKASVDQPSRLSHTWPHIVG